MKLKIGLDAINSYKRLAYTPWHAIAELVDNSTQSYFNHGSELDQIFKQEEGKLKVSIVYDRADGGLLRVCDNAMGMSFDELDKALHIGSPPSNTSGRSKYGMGLKTSASWIGNEWSVRTKKLGETVEHSVTVNVEKVSAGNDDLGYKSKDGRPESEHYTIIDITKHNRSFHGRTISKIKEFLRSMYREDLRKDFLCLEWQHDALSWIEFDMLTNKEGHEYKKEFSFTVEEKPVDGWVGVLKSGSRANAGFSILHCGRVVKGWPESWRPSSLYGQLQGSNDLVNQRLVGEIHLDAFDVSHTKDDILWLGSEEEEVESGLEAHCGDYKEVAKVYRKGNDDDRGPTSSEVDVAVDELKKELSSPEFVDKVKLDIIPPEEAVKESVDTILQRVKNRSATYQAQLEELTVKGFLETDTSPFEPYVAVDTTSEDEVTILINVAHPHFKQLKGSDGVLNYLRHCTYDAIAEWQAMRKAGRVDPDTIKLLKDRMLRVHMDIEMHAGLSQ